MRKQGIGEGHAAFHERSGLGNIGRHFDPSAFSMRFQKQYLIQANAFVAKQVR